MDARPIELLGESDLLRAQRSAGQALDAWRAFWGLAPREAQTACVRAWQSAERVREVEKDWSCWAGDNGEWAAASPGLVSGVRRALFGAPQIGVPESGAPVALDTCDQAVEDLVVRLLKKTPPAAVARRVTGAAASLPVGALAHGSGSALLDIHTCEARLLVVTRCSPPIRQDRAGSQPFAESHLAMHSVPVTVAAELDDLDMDLATLQSLEAGDVIRLGAKIDHPLRISAPGGGTICFGDFGTVGGFRALALRKSAAHEGA